MFHSLPQYRAITVTFVPATNHKGARVKFYDSRQKHVKFVPYSYEIGNVDLQGYNTLIDNGFNIVGYESDLDKITFLCDNWGDQFVHVTDIK